MKKFAVFNKDLDILEVHESEYMAEKRAAELATTGSGSVYVSHIVSEWKVGLHKVELSEPGLGRP